MEKTYKMMHAVYCFKTVGLLLNLLFLTQVSCVYEPIDQDMNTSYKECKDKCTEWTECKSAQYFVSFKLCKSYDVKLDHCEEQTRTCTNEHGVKYYMKPGQLVNEQKNIPQVPGVCPSPPPIKNAAVFGNMRKFGSRIKYVCKMDESQWAISVCQTDGTWTKADLICFTICESPQFNQYQGKVIAGPVNAINETHFNTDLSCQCGNYECELRQLQDGIICDIFDGIWHGIEFVCCNRKRFNHGTRMYTINNDTDTTRTGQWSPDDDSTILADRRNGIIGEKCFYQNTEFWNNWRNMDIAEIRLRVKIGENKIKLNFRPDKVASLGSNVSWFSIEALDYTNQWTDLMNMNSSDVEFSLKKDWYGGTLDLVAAKTINNDPCETHKGWFMITDHYYPCGSPNHSGKRILYANNAAAAAFVEGKVGFADKVKIWVKFN